MSNNFNNMIKEWVTIDNELRQLNLKTKSLREKKNIINNNVISYIENNNLDNPIIKISDGTLKFNHTNISQPLTFKYINDCLNDIIKDKEQVQIIINHIKNKRNIKSVMDIKRNYN